MSRPWPEAPSGNHPKRRGLLASLLAATTAGCALLTCQPVTVVVADKEERVRLELVPVGLRTTEIGRLEEVEGLRRVRTYWIRSDAGRWYDVSPVVYGLARAGEHAEVCR